MLDIYLMVVLGCQLRSATGQNFLNGATQLFTALLFLLQSSASSLKQVKEFSYKYNIITELAQVRTSPSKYFLKGKVQILRCIETSFTKQTAMIEILSNFFNLVQARSWLIPAFNKGWLKKL